MKQYPIGIQNFASIINGGFVYVDKTELVYQLASVKGVYFLSRPRGFGKSLLVSTLKYYFQGCKDLFKGLKMETLEKDWKEYPVFEIDFNGKDYTQVGALEKTLEEYVSSWERIYGKSPYASFLGSRFLYVLHQAHEKTGQRCVVLIDGLLCNDALRGFPGAEPDEEESGEWIRSVNRRMRRIRL